VTQLTQSTSEHVVSPLETLERMRWQGDRMLLDDLVFRLEHYRDDASWELGDECFRFFKIESLVDEYAKFLRLHQDFRPRNVFELGIWDGGSVAFWFELFHPRRHVAIDLTEREDSHYFTRYTRSRGLADAIATYWGTDQAERERLRAIAASELDGELDLVIDDCSHLYGPTRASFEALFPLLRPGGLYILEDWAWSHWDEFQSPLHIWSDETPLTRLVFDCVEAIGSSPHALANMTVYRGFAVVERGPDRAISSASFSLDDVTVRRPVDRAREPAAGTAVRSAALLRHGVGLAKGAARALPRRGTASVRKLRGEHRELDLERLHQAGRRMGDEAWLDFWIRGLDREVVDGLRLPRFPHPSLQEAMVGSSGAVALQEACRFYREVRDYCGSYGRVGLPESDVLDFGFGWGRHLRLFLKDVPPERLCGIDVDEVLVDNAKWTLPGIRFEASGALPPATLDDSSLDLVYAYSVFSHLAEHAHQAWVTELHRLLRPGGLLVVTTWRKSFIDYCEAVRREGPESDWHESLASCFTDVQASKDAYDGGAFLFCATGAAPPRDASFYGDAVVSPKYVRATWAGRFEIVDFVEDRLENDQAIVVARKPL